MLRFLKISVLIHVLFVVQAGTAQPDAPKCPNLLARVMATAPAQTLKRKINKRILDVIAFRIGLPKYRNFIKQSQQSQSYKIYDTFAEMGLAEFGISVRYNQAKLDGLKVKDSLVTLPNHHLGIADGLAVHHIVARARRGDGLVPERPTSLLLLARWIKELLPFAVYQDPSQFGTAVPIEINLPKDPSAPDYVKKMGEAKAFNFSATKKVIRVLRSGGDATIFSAGGVAPLDASQGYPEGVADAEGSWKPDFLDMARLGEAKFVFAKVDAVNSKKFYEGRKKYGGFDYERVIRFLEAAILKRGQAIDVYLSDPMSLDEVYETFARVFKRSREEMSDDPYLLAELMRQYTYRLPELVAQELDTIDSPTREKAILRAIDRAAQAKALGVEPPVDDAILAKAL